VKSQKKTEEGAMTFLKCKVTPGCETTMVVTITKGGGEEMVKGGFVIEAKGGQKGTGGGKE